MTDAILNKAQCEAVDFTDGPCLVIAGAGSGKTKVLTARINRLIAKNIPPWQILAITFTNKAAQEMRERLVLLKKLNSPFVGTFHSFGLKIIRENLTSLDLATNFTIVDKEDALSIIKKIMHQRGYDVKEVAPGFIRSKISFIKNEMLRENEIHRFLNTRPEQIAYDVYLEYENILRRNNSVDFDDLLKLPVQLLTQRADILTKYQEQYRYILIDEYQDTNEVQYRLIKLLAQKRQNVFAVGDPNQSIYAFRQANYQNILNFEKDYPGAKVIVLKQNYRSTNNILNAANSVIKNNKERKELNLFSELGDGVKLKYLRSYDEKHEVTLIINEIKHLLTLGYHFSDIAIFYRTNAQARIIEEKLLHSEIDFRVIGSYYFYDRKEIKDLICYLRLIYNHHDDVSLKRIINVPKRKIGAKTIAKLEQAAINQNQSLFEVIESGKELEFKKLINLLSEASEKMSLTELVTMILTESKIKAELEAEKTLESELRLDNLNEFLSITASFEERTGSVNLGDFLEELSLVADINAYQKNDNVVTLMTLHSAKGLEFKVVFISGMEEGLFPHCNALLEPGGIEEERRLCYVGLTRAKERLYLTNAKQRLLYGRETKNTPSRFISEIDNILIETTSETSKSKIDLTEMINTTPVTFKKGEIINHTFYGKGVVIEVDDKYITVAFNLANGVRKLIKNHKSIQRGE